MCLVTGATGFIGSALVQRLIGEGCSVDAVARDPQLAPAGVRRTYSELPEEGVELEGVQCVFHCAGLAHEAGRGADLEQLTETNVHATTALYRAARDAGVRRFVWLSSIKVLGDQASEPLTPATPYAPVGAYAASKVQAEQALAALADARCRIIIVRPPLVYGPGVKANFLSLLKWARSGIPLPLAAATQPRAWLSVGNLCDLLVRVGMEGCSEESLDDALRIFHVRDAEQTSVRDMLVRLRCLLGQPSRLFTVSSSLGLALGRLFGRAEVTARLFSPLEIDMQSTQALLDWQPPQTQEDALAQTVAWLQTQA